MIFTERSIKYLKTKDKRSKKCYKKQMANFFYIDCYKKVVFKASSVVRIYAFVLYVKGVQNGSYWFIARIGFAYRPGL